MVSFWWINYVIGLFLNWFIIMCNYNWNSIRLQLFKMGKLVLMPFGTDVKIEFNEHPLANILLVIF